MAQSVIQGRRVKEKEIGTTFAVFIALAGDLSIAVIKFVAAGMSGSAAMLSEALHSLEDAANQVLLLYGMKRSRVASDQQHALGHGREVYFWSFIVALLIAVAAGVAVYEGLDHLIHPQPIQEPALVLAVLAISLLLDSASLIVSLRESGPAIGRVGWWRAFRNSKNPPSFITLFTNSAALGGDVVAGAGMGLAITTGRSRWDAVASLIIGAFLAVSAALLARESKGLLIGERADPELGKAILAAARGIEGIGQANGIATVQLAPDQVVVNLSIEFDDALHTTQIEAAVVELERRLREAHPQITAVFVKPQAAEEVRRRLAQGGIGVTPDGE